MRYSNEHKQQTRERLLASSGALAKRGGFASTGVAGLREAAFRAVLEHDAATQGLLEAGLVAQVERLQARAAMEEAKRNAQKARDDAELASTALARTIRNGERVQAMSPLFVISSPIEPLGYFIDAALERIQAGSYGTCTDCGIGIPAARLNAHPSAKRCIDCQSLAEHRH